MYHIVIVVGNVGKDPEMRYTPQGQAVTNFNVAANRQYKTKEGETVKETIWFRVQSWGKRAEVNNQYVKKGMKVLVEGTLIPDKATGAPKVFKKQNGESGATFEVNASTVRFLSRVEAELYEGNQGENDGSALDEDEFPF